MKSIVLISVVFLLSHVMLLAQNKEEKELIIKTIQANDKQIELFIMQNMTDSITKMFSPNCHFMPEYGELVEEKDAVSKYLSASFKSGVKIKYFKFNPIERKVYGDIVLEIGTFDIKYTLPSNPTEVKAKYNYLINWKASKKGKYRIRVATWNSLKKP